MTQTAPDPVVHPTTVAPDPSTGVNPFALLDVETMTPGEALRAAEDLASQRRWFDAIDLLTQVNRREPTFEVEYRLVDFRHRAFSVVDRRPGRHVWEPVIADPFPADVGVPEVGRDRLDVETLGGGILHHGCLLVRNLVPEAQALALADLVNRSFDARESRLAGDGSDELDPWASPFAASKEYGDYPITMGTRHFVREGGGLLAVDAPRALFHLTELYNTSDFLPVIADYLGERPVISAKKCILRRTPPDSLTNWHQDGAFLGNTTRTVNVWISLSYCGRDAPGIDIVPGRPEGVIDTGTDGAAFAWSAGDGAVERFSGSGDVLRPMFAPGDALLFDQRLMHRTAVSPEMTEQRLAVECWFFAPSTFPPVQLPIVL